VEPTIGRTVLYRLTRPDVIEINWRRVRAHEHLAEFRATGAQWHEGNQAHRGDIVPLVITRVWPYEYNPDTTVCRDYMAEHEDDIVWSNPLSHWGVNGQAILDGNDHLWVTSAPEGQFNGAWCWPTLQTVDYKRTINEQREEAGLPRFDIAALYSAQIAAHGCDALKRRLDSRDAAFAFSGLAARQRRRFSRSLVLSASMSLLRRFALLALSDALAFSGFSARHRAA